MVELEFDFKQEKTIIQVNLDDLFITAASKFCNKNNIKQETVFFMAEGIIIPGGKKIMDLMNETGKRDKKMHILVYPYDRNSKQEKTIVESKEIICPKCFGHCRIKIENYKIKLFDCKNNHLIEKSLDKFKESQKIDLSKIICDKCKIKNKGNTFNNEFYKCLNCKMNLCVLCKSIHNKTHNIIDYEQKNYLCIMHHDSFFKYCHRCKNNICMLCIKNHINHKIESFENIIPNQDDKRNKLDRLRNEINNFNNDIKKS